MTPNKSENGRVTVSEDQEGKRLDALLSEVTGMTRSSVVRLIENGNITVNGKSVSKKEKPVAGSVIEWNLPKPEPAKTQAQEIPLDIVYEDRDIIVINKPVGLVVHPAAGNPDKTLVNALLWHCGDSLSGIGGEIRPGIVHRIDKDTSGLLVVAKNDTAHLSLAEQIKEHKVSRVYTAIVIGNLREDAGTIDAPIGRHPTDRKRMAIIRDGKSRSRNAVTHWKVLSRGEADGNRFTLVRCELETGRTHQIRVHLSSIGHPILGDSLYGGSHTAFEKAHRGLIHGQCLHAGELTLTHPVTGEQMTFRADLPDDYQKLVRILFQN